jgi:antitoxin VapB
MGLTLEDQAIDRIAHDLAMVTGESVADAMRIAASERLEREREKQRAASKRIEGMLEAARRFAALPDLDTSSPDEIIGYDETGMWPSTRRRSSRSCTSSRKPSASET